MLRFTKRADYGLMAIHYIAIHEERGSVSAKRIADEFRIPPELLAKILQRLARERLIVSHNGPKGGYALARRPAEISVEQVIRALEGPANILGWMEAHGDGTQMARCSLRRPVQKIQGAISQMLDSVSLAELVANDVPELFAIR